MHRVIAALAVAIVVAAGTYVFRPSVRDDAAAARADSAFVASGVAEPAGRAERREVERLISAFELRIRQHTDPLDYKFLGRLYLDRARTSGDVDSYASAATALERALALTPSDPEALVLLGSVRYATHDFAAARDIGRRVYAADGAQVAALLLAADAALELGTYDEAADAYAALERSLPSTGAIEAREARLAFLRGRARDAATLAARAESDAATQGAFGAGLAWYAHLRAQLAFDAGDYAAAEAHERRALAIAPEYHVSLAGLGRALAAVGRDDDALAAYERAIAIVPQPDYLAALGDIAARAGDGARATKAYATIDAIASLAPERARLYDRQLALFDVDHGRSPERALEIASASLAARPDIYGLDAYAWALYANGRYADARTASDRARALGTADARLLYHAGTISLALGDAARGRDELTAALRLSPEFDPLQAARARDALGARP